MKRRSTPLDIANKVDALLKKAALCENFEELDLCMYELMDMCPGDLMWVMSIAKFEENFRENINNNKDDNNEELQGSCEQEREASQI